MGMGGGGSFPRGKARPGRDADHSPPSSAEVKKEWELYLLSSKCVMGLLYLTLPIKLKGRDCLEELCIDRVVILK
jgi:hypothetical protein